MIPFLKKKKPLRISKRLGGGPSWALPKAFGAGIPSESPHSYREGSQMLLNLQSSFSDISGYLLRLLM